MEISSVTPITTTTQSVADKLADVALALAVVNSVEDEAKTDEILKMLLLDLLFGNGETSTLSPSEQAELINELVSSGQPGAISQAMGEYTSTSTYNSSGATAAPAPVGIAISTTV